MTNSGINPVTRNPEFVHLIDQASPEDHRVKKLVTVEGERCGVSLRVRGYGTADTDPGYGPVVLLEVVEGVPRVVIWADIASEEPTHVVSLEKANEKYRREEE